MTSCSILSPNILLRSTRAKEFIFFHSLFDGNTFDDIVIQLLVSILPWDFSNSLCKTNAPQEEAPLARSCFSLRSSRCSLDFAMALSHCVLDTERSVSTDSNAEMISSSNVGWLPLTGRR